MKKEIIKNDKPQGNMQTDTIQTDAEIYLDFGPLLQATSVGEADNGQSNPYRFTGYSVAHGYIMRGVYDARKKAKEFHDSLQESLDERARKMGGDIEAIGSDDITANLNRRKKQAQIQWNCLLTMCSDIQAKYKAVTNEDCETYEAWLKNKEAWAAGKLIKKAVNNTKIDAALDELVADLAEVA